MEFDLRHGHGDVVLLAADVVVHVLSRTLGEGRQVVRITSQSFGLLSDCIGHELGTFEVALASDEFPN